MADAKRYMIEDEDIENREKIIGEAEYLYKLIILKSEENLSEIDTTLFCGVILNFSVFLTEIKRQRQKAITFLKY